MSDLTREIKFRPGYDKRSSKPGENYGIHPMEIEFILKGPEGAIVLYLCTSWYVQSVRKEIEPTKYFTEEFCLPKYGNIGVYAKVPMGGEFAQSSDCVHTGGECYSFYFSLLYKEKIQEKFLENGEKAVWEELEILYNENLLGSCGNWEI